MPSILLRIHLLSYESGRWCCLLKAMALCTGCLTQADLHLASGATVVPKWLLHYPTVLHPRRPFAWSNPGRPVRPRLSSFPLRETILAPECSSFAAQCWRWTATLCLAPSICLTEPQYHRLSRKTLVTDLTSLVKPSSLT
eukprot:Gb_37288 [translate_table: standard]